MKDKLNCSTDLKLSENKGSILLLEKNVINLNLLLAKVEDSREYNCIAFLWKNSDHKMGNMFIALTHKNFQRSTLFEFFSHVFLGTGIFSVM